MPILPIRIHHDNRPGMVFNPEQLQVPGDIELGEFVDYGVIQKGTLTTSVEVVYPGQPPFGGSVVFPIGSRANVHHTMGVPDYVLLFAEDGEVPNYQPAIGGRLRRQSRRRRRSSRNKRRKSYRRK